MASPFFPWETSAPSNPGKPTTIKPEIPLFSPFTLRGLTLKNRIVVSPMCTYSSSDGFATDWHITHLTQFALGGAALVFTEATGVSPEGRISPYCTGIWKDEQIEKWKEVVKSVHSHNSLIGMQLAHSGRKGSTTPPWDPRRAVLPPGTEGWQTVAPSPIPYHESQQPPHPHELTIPEIQNLVKAFAEAAIRCEKAGFDTIEIHGAHGYLISTFNSPLTNLRTDEYGGDFSGRTRFVREIAAAVRNVFPVHKPVFYRANSVDWAPGGWTITDTVQLAKELKKIGIDSLDCSSGGTVSKASGGPFFSDQIPFAEAVKKEAGLPTIAVGSIKDPVAANQIILDGRADLVALARGWLHNPRWALDAAKALNVRVEYATQYGWTYG
eukprot:TRINITY_DN6453_c0_g2_i1.p1 TRINITY_DN6453_c0_g2~~TRINITY_DN6453_c0_g2_i1.p1  ORF type:complete len:382 (-),score=64.62 TRINITY_DN6453_c0_g2_i1:134-1279(-)